MKKTFILIICLFFCCIQASAKTIVKYKDNGNNSSPIKRYEIIQTKKDYKNIVTNTGQKIMVVNSDTKNKFKEKFNIEGILVNKDNKPITNQKIIIYSYESNKQTEIKTDYNGKFKTNFLFKKDTISNNYKIKFVFPTEDDLYEHSLSLGKDCSNINSPRELIYEYPFNYVTKIIPDDSCEEMKKTIQEEVQSNIIVLDKTNLSGKYFIKQALKYSKSKLDEIPLTQNINKIILNDNGYLKNDWKSIIDNIVDYATRLHGYNKNTNVSKLILTKDLYLKDNWKDILKEKIKIEEEKEQKEIERKQKLREKRLKRIVEDPDNMNLTFKDESDIFEALGGCSANNLYPTYKSLHNVIVDRWICAPVKIFQIVGSNKILFDLGSNPSFIFYGILAKSCRKNNFYNGQWVEIAAVIEGTYSYITTFGGTNTVPRIKVYAIRLFER